MAGIIGALLGAIFAGGFTILNNRDSLNDALDSKSGWREKIFDVASKNNIELDDIYRIRAALRFAKYKETPPKFSTDWMTQQIISFCEDVISDQQKNHLKKISMFDQEIARIYCRYLLKIHWEYRTSMATLITGTEERKKTDFKKYARETMKLVMKQLSDQNEISIVSSQIERQRIDRQINSLKSSIDKEENTKKALCLIFIVSKYLFISAVLVVIYLIMINYAIVDKKNNCILIGALTVMIISLIGLDLTRKKK